MKLNTPDISLADVIRIASETAQMEHYVVEQVRTIIRDQIERVHEHPQAGPWNGEGVRISALPRPQDGVEITFRGVAIIKAEAGNGVFTIQFIKHAKAN